MGHLHPTQSMRMISCNVRVREGKRVNKGDRFYERRTACLLIPEYAGGLKVLDGRNLRIDTIGCARIIRAFLVIERLASVGILNWQSAQGWPLRIPNFGQFLSKSDFLHIKWRRIPSSEMPQLSILEITSNFDVTELWIKQLSIAKIWDSISEANSP